MLTRSQELTESSVPNTKTLRIAGRRSGERRIAGTALHRDMKL